RDSFVHAADRRGRTPFVHRRGGTPCNPPRYRRGRTPCNPPRIRRPFDRFYGASVDAAAAEVAGKRVADGGLVRRGVMREQRGRRDDHAAGAVAALHRVLRDERLLHGVKVVALSQPLDRRDLALDRLPRGHEARRNGSAVHDDVARAALAAAAAEARPGQAEIIAEHAKERSARRWVHAVGCAVDDEDEPHAYPAYSRGGDDAYAGMWIRVTRRSPTSATAAAVIQASAATTGFARSVPDITPCANAAKNAM